jgi:WD40 repeat protein
MRVSNTSPSRMPMTSGRTAALAAALLALAFDFTLAQIIPAALGTDEPTDFSSKSEVLTGARIPIRAVAISPDGGQVAIAMFGGGIQLHDRTSGRVIRTIDQREAWSLAFSPDGKLLAGGGPDGMLRWWSASGEGHSEFLGGHSGPITCVAWSPRGGIVATASADGTIRLRDPLQRKEVAVLEGHTDVVSSIAFTPDGKRLVSSGNDTKAIVWDLEKRTMVGMLNGHADAVRAVAVSPDGATFATGGDDLVVRLWDAATLRPRAAMKGHQQPVSSLAFSPQGLSLASGGAGGGVMLWNVARGVARKTLNGHLGSVTGVGFLPDGSGLLSSGIDGTVRLWKANFGSVAALASVPAHQKAYAVKFSPDGRWIASGGENKLVTLRDPNTGAVRETLSGHSGQVYDVAFSPDGKRLASASADGTVRIWSVYQGTLLAKYDAFGTRRSNIRSVAYSADGREIATGSEDGTIMLWSVTDEKVRKVLPTQALPVLCVRYSPDGSLLATSTGMNQRPQEKGELQLWKPDTGEEVARLEGHATEIKRIAFDASGRRMVSAGDRSIIVWNVAERTMESRFQAEAVVGAVAFLADSDLLAVGDGRGGVAIYSIERGSAVHRYAGHQNLIPAISVRPDQQTIATASHDGTLKLWPGPAAIAK